MPNDQTSCTASNRRRGDVHLASRVPDRVRIAIERATDDVAAASTAYRLFLEDTKGALFDNTAHTGRLEHAVARAMLDAWAHGQGSAEDVGWPTPLLESASPRKRSTYPDESVPDRLFASASLLGRCEACTDLGSASESMCCSVNASAHRTRRDQASFSTTLRV
jgi:hypothetical protein